MTEALLILAGLIGGALNALAGGGSFVVFPALLFAGVPPIAANATNTFAALPGYAAGAAGFWKDIAKQRTQWLLFYGFAAAIGGFLGAELLLTVSDDQFRMAVPWLMAFAVIAFAIGGQVNRWIVSGGGGQNAARVFAAVVAALLLVVCIYGGFFNAGLGILLLAVLALGGMSDIHAMNGLKLLISTIVAVIAVARFAVGGSIVWYEGVLALIGTTIGGYLAARIAHRIPTAVIRGLVIVYGAVLTAWFFWDAYGAS